MRFTLSLCPTEGNNEVCLTVSCSAFFRLKQCVLSFIKNDNKNLTKAHLRKFTPDKKIMKFA